MVQAIEEALQAEGLVLTRETDLEAVNWYLADQRQGELTVVLEEVSEEGAKVIHQATIACTFGLTPLGEFIIRWHSEAIEDVMTNGRTFLSFVSPETLGERVEIYFNRVREVFFGETKAFIICTPVKANG